MSSSDNSIEYDNVVKHVQAIQLAGGSEGYQQSIQQAKPEIQESDIDFKYKIGISIDFPTLPIQIITVKVDNGWSAAGWASGFNSSAVPHYPFRAELKYNDWDTLTSGRCSWLIRPHLIGGLQLVIVRGDALVLGAVDLPFDRSDSGLQGAYGGLTWSPPKDDPAISIAVLNAIELAGGASGYKEALALPDEDLATTKIGLPQKTGVAFTFFTFYIHDVPHTLISMKTDNGYVGTGWARNAFASSSIKGELHFLDMDRLTSETCRWRIRSAGPDKLGGLVMTMVQGAVSLVGQVNFGLFEADVGVVGSFGHIRFSKA